MYYYYAAWDSHISLHLMMDSSYSTYKLLNLNSPSIRLPPGVHKLLFTLGIAHQQPRYMHWSCRQLGNVWRLEYIPKISLCCHCSIALLRVLKHSPSQFTGLLAEENVANLGPLNCYGQISSEQTLQLSTVICLVKR